MRCPGQSYRREWSWYQRQFLDQQSVPLGVKSPRLLRHQLQGLEASIGNSTEKTDPRPGVDRTRT